MGREPRQADRTETGAGRSKRIPLGRPRFKLKANHLIPPDKIGRWINDDPGRLEDAQQAGYTFVKDSDAQVGEGAENERDGLSSSVRRRVGVRADGKAKMAYLMAISREFFEEDQTGKEQDRKEIESGLRRGEVDQGLKAEEGRYIPKEGITIEQTTSTKRSAE